MKLKPQWEILVGDEILALFASQDEQHEQHPLQEILEEFINTQLDDYDRELFYMRFGEQLPIRTIARRLGYNSHMVIQVQLQRIVDKARLWLDNQAHVEFETNSSESEGMA